MYLLQYAPRIKMRGVVGEGKQPEGYHDNTNASLNKQLK